MTDQAVRAWMDEYAAAWRGRDAARAALLFAEDARYTSDPFGEPLRGRAAIEAYWAQALAGQEDIEFAAGAPVVSGDRATVEWWVSFRKGGEEWVLAAALLLRFDADGRCAELREYWLRGAARVPPPAGWLSAQRAAQDLSAGGLG